MNKRVLKEAAIGYVVLEEKLQKLNEEILNEQFFQRLGQMGRAVAGKFGRRGEGPEGSLSAGGATSRELEAELPEMKALEVGLRKVSDTEKKLKNMKISNVDALDGALDQYVTSLIDVFGEFKEYVDNPEKRSELPDVSVKLQAAFRGARKTLRQLQQAISDASSKISQALKGSSLAATTVDVPLPKTGIPAAAPSARPASYMGAAGVRGARGIGGTYGARGLAENKKVPSLKELYKI